MCTECVSVKTLLGTNFSWRKMSVLSTGDVLHCNSHSRTLQVRIWVKDWCYSHG